MYGTSTRVGPRREELREQDVEREEREDEVDPAAAERAARSCGGDCLRRRPWARVHPPPARVSGARPSSGAGSSGRGAGPLGVLRSYGRPSRRPEEHVADPPGRSPGRVLRLRRTPHGGPAPPGLRPPRDRRPASGHPGPWSPRAARGLPRPDDVRDARGHLLDPHERPAPAPGDGLAARLRLRHPRRRPLPRQRVRPAPGDLAPRSGSSRRSSRRIDDLGLPAVAPRLRHASRAASSSSPARRARASRPRSPAIIDEINRTREEHILTIEDPIEFLHSTRSASSTSARSARTRSPSPSALKGALRQDPDVILVGEMRDLETIHTALTAAETGHLVFATLHTQDTPQTIDRIIDVFPPEQQQQVRVQLVGRAAGHRHAAAAADRRRLRPHRRLRGARADPRDPQPDPRGQDPPDLLRRCRPARTWACRRWTRRWRTLVRPGKITREARRERARPRPRSCAACSAHGADARR